MNYSPVHIGKKIEEEFIRQKLSQSDFGRMIGVPQQNVRRIFEKESIDTSRLVAISQALGFDFFVYYRSDEQHTEITATATSTCGQASFNNSGLMIQQNFKEPTDETATNTENTENTQNVVLLQERIRFLEREIETLNERIKDKQETIDILKSR